MNWERSIFSTSGIVIAFHGFILGEGNMFKDTNQSDLAKQLAILMEDYEEKKA